jgi:uncharacterized protein YuzE
MQVRLDREHNRAEIRLDDAARGVETLVFSDVKNELAWGINLDFDANGHLVGIEFEGADEFLPPALLAQAKRI